MPTQTDPKEPRKKKRNKKEKEKVAKDASLLGPKSGPGAEVVRREDEEEWDGSEEMRKRVLNDYMDEMYKMDFNDIVSLPDLWGTLLIRRNHRWPEHPPDSPMHQSPKTISH